MSDVQVRAQPSPKPSSDAAASVMAGKDGWLFLRSGGQDQMAFLLGDRTPDDASVAAFWSNLRARAADCARHGLPYLHVVFPSKPTIMTRYLPDDVAGRVQSLYRRCYAPAAPAGAEDLVLYPDAVLRDLDRTELPFLPTDTHMTDAGSAAVALAILSRWGLAYDLDAVFRRVEGRWPEDLANMLGTPQKPAGPVLAAHDLRPAVFDNARFLPGNHDNIRLVHNPRAATPRKLAVVGDSFFNACLRFLTPAFRDILYLRGPGFHADALRRFRPDAVLSGNAERYLSRVPGDDAVEDILSRLARRADYHPDDAFVAALTARLGPLPDGAGPTDATADLRRRLALRVAELAEARKRNRDVADRLREAQRDLALETRRAAELEDALRQLRHSRWWRLGDPLRRARARLGRQG